MSSTSENDENEMWQTFWSEMKISNKIWDEGSTLNKELRLFYK